ncbi:uncharacterized protein DS421_7g214820 [Arachis hypogaea]|nr:uncharacterized protein DS421_7g214820 [Arachis hypogaea]
MVAAYNIRHGAWLRAYYEGDSTLCTSIRNLDGSRIVYPKPRSQSSFVALASSGVNHHRTRVVSRDVMHTGDVIAPFSIEYTPPTSPVCNNAFGSPLISTNSLGCPVYVASTTSHASPVGRVDLRSQIRSLSPTHAGVFFRNLPQASSPSGWVTLDCLFHTGYVGNLTFAFQELNRSFPVLFVTSSIYLANGATVALPPTFYREFRSELPDEVRFVDSSGRQFTMLLHKTPALCLIVAGFPQLINAFTIKGRCWFFMAYLGDAEFLMFHVLEVNAPLPAAGVSPMYPLAVHELLGNACGNLAAYFVPALSQDEDLLLPHSIHSNLPSVIYPMGDTYTIQFASTIQNLPMLSLLLNIYFTFATDYEAKPLDYRAFASMLGHYSNFCPGALHSMLPNREAVVVDKLILKYQATEYILTLPIGFVQRAFGIKPDQVDVVDDAGVCYKVHVRSKPSRPRVCYFAKGWRPFSQHHMLRTGSAIRLMVYSFKNWRVLLSCPMYLMPCSLKPKTVLPPSNIELGVSSMCNMHFIMCCGLTH